MRIVLIIVTSLLGLAVLGFLALIAKARVRRSRQPASPEPRSSPMSEAEFAEFVSRAAEPAEKHREMARGQNMGTLSERYAAKGLLLMWMLGASTASTAEQEGADSRNRAPAPAAPGVEVSRKGAPASNEDDIATVELGNERPGDRITHLFRERDGRTTVQTLDGVLCRYLNRKAETKSFGYVYFSIDPEFKQENLKSAWIDLECLVRSPTIIRLQYDGMEGDKPKKYKSVLATGRSVSGVGGQVPFSVISGSNGWQKISFHATDAVFMNSQNGGADFRFEVQPAEIYLRKVSVRREKAAGVQ